MDESDPKRIPDSMSDAVVSGGIVGDGTVALALATLPVWLLPGRHADRVALLVGHPVPAAERPSWATPGSRPDASLGPAAC